VSDNVSLIKIINKDFEFENNLSDNQLREALINAFAYLIDNDFSKMIQILYKADVNQEKLKLLLETSESSNAEVIADAYINRQLAKVETWKKYSSK
jgi:hypothetical protein